MLKKINIAIILWLTVFSINATGTSITMRYEIYNDTSSTDELMIKDNIISVYQEIIYGVDESTRSSLIKKNAHLFALEDDFDVEVSYDTIIIKVGDGEGTLVSGEFDWAMCSNEVKPKSFIKELLSQ